MMLDKCYYLFTFD